MRTLTNEDIIKGSSFSDYEGQVVIVAPSTLKEEFRKGEFQLLKAGGGFGCDPTTMGSAVFATELFREGESNRWERGDLIGIAKPEVIEEFTAWKAEKEAAKEVAEAELYAKIREAAKAYPMFSRKGQDIEDAINFVGDLIDIEVEHLEEHESYATRTIRDLRIGRERLHAFNFQLDFTKLDQ